MQTIQITLTNRYNGKTTKMRAETNCYGIHSAPIRRTNAALERISAGNNPVAVSDTFTAWDKYGNPIRVFDHRSDN